VFLWLGRKRDNSKSLAHHGHSVDTYMNTVGARGAGVSHPMSRTRYVFSEKMRKFLLSEPRTPHKLSLLFPPLHMLGKLADCQGKFLSSPIDCVKEVLGRAWFEECATMQELLLSPKAVVACGSTSWSGGSSPPFGEYHRAILGDQADKACSPLSHCCEAWTVVSKSESY